MKSFGQRNIAIWVAILTTSLLFATTRAGSGGSGGSATTLQKPGGQEVGQQASGRTGSVRGPAGGGLQAGFLDIDNDVFDVEDMNAGPRPGFEGMEAGGYPIVPPMMHPSMAVAMAEEEAAAAAVAEASEMRGLTKKKGGYSNYGSMGYQPFYYPQPTMMSYAMPTPVYYSAPRMYRPPSYGYYPQSYRCSSCY